MLLMCVSSHPFLRERLIEVRRMFSKQMWDEGKIDGEKRCWHLLPLPFAVGKATDFVFFMSSINLFGGEVGFYYSWDSRGLRKVLITALKANWIDLTRLNQLKLTWPWNATYRLLEECCKIPVLQFKHTELLRFEANNKGLEN